MKHVMPGFWLKCVRVPCCLSDSAFYCQHMQEVMLLPQDQLLRILVCVPGRLFSAGQSNHHGDANAKMCK